MLDSQVQLVTKTQVALSRLDESHLDFNLTGSRLFGGARPDSDYDFFVEDEPFIEDVLEGMGFVRLPFTNYKDNETISVYRFIVADEGTQIDIQVVGDAETKMKAQELLLSTIPQLVRGKSSLGPLDRSRKHLWNMAYEIVKMRADNAKLVDAFHAIGTGIKKTMDDASDVLKS